MLMSNVVIYLHVLCTICMSMYDSHDVDLYTMCDSHDVYLRVL
jgi:hypothetical protein